MQQELEDRVFGDRPSPTRRWARQRAEMLQGLYIHLLVYVVIIGGLFLLNWVTIGDEGAWWAVWPAGIWGLGLAVHVLVTVVPVFSNDWLERKTEELARRD